MTVSGEGEAHWPPPSRAGDCQRGGWEGSGGAKKTYGSMP